MVLRASTPILVPFHDVDVLEIAWHGHYLKYFEVARSRLMQTLQLDWPELRAGGVAMPIVEAHVSYRRPLPYNAAVKVEARIEEYCYAELKIHYLITDERPGPSYAEGWTRQVYISIPERTALFEVPDFVRRRLDEASR